MDKAWFIHKGYQALLFILMLTLLPTLGCWMVLKSLCLFNERVINGTVHLIGRIINHEIRKV